MNETANCLICTRELWEDELGRYACKPCERRIDDRLRALAGPYGLYARLCLRNEPGAPGTGPRVTGSATAGIAGNLNILNETANGGVVSVLEGWVEDWATYGLGIRGTGGRLQHRLDQAVATLRRNLAQAVWRHPAIDDFAGELRDTVRRYENVIDGGKPAPVIKATCTCGQTMRVPVDAAIITCRGCDTGYGWEEFREMAVAQRSAA
ncbi:hypothetical protein ACIGO7_35460 [Streptomyces virginiae]|uniref:hypothetical protein n=1 Tax=Streptomyces virginiae TaxID=1961 RepID=UPI00344DF963